MSFDGRRVSMLPGALHRYFRMAMSGLARNPHGVTDWSAKMTNGLPVTKATPASVSSHATVPVLRLDLRAHDLLRDVPLYDVSIVDLPGGGAGRSVADIRALESAAAPSRVANAIYGLRHFLGRVFGWEHVQIRPEDSLLSRLSERDRRDSEITPGTPVGSFLLLYQFPGEALSETRNATLHGYVCTALAPTASGYRLYWGIYVIPVSWLTRPYLIAIESFRRILYPAMLRRIRRAWLVAYGLRARWRRPNQRRHAREGPGRSVRSTPIASGWPKQSGPTPYAPLLELANVAELIPYMSSSAPYGKLRLKAK